MFQSMPSLFRSIMASVCLLICFQSTQVQGAAEVYWTAGGTVYRADLDGSNAVSIGNHGAFALAGDTVSDKIYSLGNGAIKRFNLDGSGVETLITGQPFGEGIAVDPIGGKIYWSVYYDWEIRRADLDGSNVETIVTANPSTVNGRGDQFSGIALDLGAGKIYFTNTELGPSKIERANLDGTDREDIVVFSTDALYEPLGFAIDPLSSRIYWADYQQQHIRSANFNGGDVQLVIDTSPDNLLALAVDPVQQNVYWGDFSGNQIHRAGYDGLSSITIASGQTQPIGGILVIPEPAGFVIWAACVGGLLVRRSRQTA